MKLSEKICIFTRKDMGSVHNKAQLQLDKKKKNSKDKNYIYIFKNN